MEWLKDRSIAIVGCAQTKSVRKLGRNTFPPLVTRPILPVATINSSTVHLILRQELRASSLQ